MQNIIEKAKAFHFNSLEYVETEDLTDSRIVINTQEGLFIMKEQQEQLQIYWAANTKEFLIAGIDQIIKDIKGLQLGDKRIFIEFIPKDLIKDMEERGFGIVSQWIDYWNHDLTKTITEGNDLVTIRLMKEEEYPLVGELTRKCKDLSREFKGESDGFVKDWIESENSWILVAEMDNQIVGASFLQLYGFDSERGTVLWLRELAVDPKHHSRRIGSGLITRTIELGVKQGAKRSFLSVDAENHHAIKIYERFGFQRKADDGQINMAKY